MVRGVPPWMVEMCWAATFVPSPEGHRLWGHGITLPLMTTMLLCGGAGLSAAVTSSTMAREGLPAHGTRASQRSQLSP
jgi:hypothetical protein